MSEEKKSYQQILKSTGIIGGSQIIVILINLVRIKIIAVILGPMGYGIMGSLQATIDLIRQATGFGLNYSAVREIAQANVSKDQKLKNKVVTILKKWAIYTGILGIIVTLALSYPLSFYAFGNGEYRNSIALISVVLLITSISSAQIVILQGFRQLKKMALSSIFGSFLGTIIVIPLYYIYGIKGIVPGLILASLSSLLVSWYFVRKIEVEKTKITFKNTITGGLNMAKLGFFLVSTSFIVSLIMYTIRGFIIRQMDIDAVGLFQASWTISNTYIGVVLTAMGADFFPRLSTIHNDNKQSNQLINQQLEIVLLIITPMLVAMIGGVKLVVWFLYTSKFDGMIPILQWQLASGLFAVISWCIGVMFLAKNKGYYPLILESLAGAIYLFFVVFTWKNLGFITLGVGYMVSTIFKTIIVVFITRKLGQFRFANTVLRDFLIYIFLVLLIFLNVNIFYGTVQYINSIIIFFITSVYAYIRIDKMIGIKNIIAKFLKK